MKSFLIIFLSLACFSQFIVAQDSTTLKKISFKIAITDTANKEIKGWLADFNDSVLSVSKSAAIFRHLPNANFHFQEIDYKRITEISLKRKNGAGHGALIGAVTGLIIGIAAGFIAGDDPHVPADQDFFGLNEAFRMSAGEKALALGISGATLGCGLGALTGALIKKIFIIGGEKEKFDKMRLNVLDKAYRND